MVFLKGYPLILWGKLLHEILFSRFMSKAVHMFASIWDMLSLET